MILTIRVPVNTELMISSVNNNTDSPVRHAKDCLRCDVHRAPPPSRCTHKHWPVHENLGCPASSAAVERLFSAVGIAFAAKRKSAKADTVRDIMFAKANVE